MLRLVLQEVGVPSPATDWLRGTALSAGIGGDHVPRVCMCVYISFLHSFPFRALLPSAPFSCDPHSCRPAGQTAAVCIAVGYCKIVFLAPGSGLSVWLSRH